MTMETLNLLCPVLVSYVLEIEVNFFAVFEGAFQPTTTTKRQIVAAAVNF